MIALALVRVCLWVRFVVSLFSLLLKLSVLFWIGTQVGLASLHASRHRAAATLVAAELGTHERGMTGMDEEFLHLALSR